MKKIKSCFFIGLLLLLFFVYNDLINFIENNPDSFDVVEYTVNDNEAWEAAYPEFVKILK